MQPAIVTEKLSKAYGRRLGIADLDLEVRPGEIFGFIGPNGAGKTTTIRLLLGLIRPTGGRATVLGRDSRRESVAVHRSIGYLPGDFGLDVRMTGRQLIRYFSRLRADDGGGNGGSAGGAGAVRDSRRPGAGQAASRTSASEASAQDLADRLGLDLDVPMGRLSRGNRQKIALVQALYHRPPLLILDEPSTGLDPLVQDTFLQILREARDEGRTVFLSSHVLSEVERVCDRVGIVRAGRLAALETTESLLEKRRKRVSLVFAAPVDASLFAALPGVSDVWVEGPRLSLRLHDGIDAVIKARLALYRPRYGRGEPHAGRGLHELLRRGPAMAGLGGVWTLASHQLRGRLRQIIIWGVVLGALGALYVALFPSMGGMLEEYMSEAPEQMQQYIGSTGESSPSNSGWRWSSSTASSRWRCPSS